MVALVKKGTKDQIRRAFDQLMAQEKSRGNKSLNEKLGCVVTYPKHPDRPARSLLRLAMHRKERGFLKILIDNGVPVNIQNEDSRNDIKYALSHKLDAAVAETVSVLMSKQDMAAPEGIFKDALRTICKRAIDKENVVEIKKYMRIGADPTWTHLSNLEMRKSRTWAWDRTTLLEYASKNGKVKALRAMIKAMDDRGALNKKALKLPADMSVRDYLELLTDEADIKSSIRQVKSR